MKQERTFTQAQAQAMYLALVDIAHGDEKVARLYAKDTLQALSAPEADASEGKRYVVRVGQAPETQMQFWCVVSELGVIEHVQSVHPTEAEAQTHADYLNAASEVQE
jgi:hypothetical protein